MKTKLPDAPFLRQKFHYLDLAMLMNKPLARFCLKTLARRTFLSPFVEGIPRTNKLFKSDETAPRCILARAALFYNVSRYALKTGRHSLVLNRDESFMKIFCIMPLSLYIYLRI